MQPEEIQPSGGFGFDKVLLAKASGGGGDFLAMQEFKEQAIGLAGRASASPRIVWNLRTATYEYPRAGNAEEASAASGTSRLCLDARYEGLTAGSRLLVADTRPGGTKRLVTIQSVDQAQDTLGAVADTVSRVTVTPALPALPDRRTVVVYELGRELAPWPARYGDAVTGDTVYLPGRVTDDGAAIELGRRIERGAFTAGAVLRPAEIDVGRTVILSDARKAPVVARVKATPTITAPDAGGFAHLVLLLDVDGALALQTDSAALEGNVADASHGESVRDEVVGGGDASVPFQRFALKRPPLTYVPGGDAGGLDSSLVLLVNGVRWTQVPTLFGQAADAHVFEARLVEDGVDPARLRRRRLRRAAADRARQRPRDLPHRDRPRGAGRRRRADHRPRPPARAARRLEHAARRPAAPTPRRATRRAGTRPEPSAPSAAPSRCATSRTSSPPRARSRRRRRRGRGTASAARSTSPSPDRRAGPSRRRTCAGSRPPSTRPATRTTRCASRTTCRSTWSSARRSGWTPTGGRDDVEAAARSTLLARALVRRARARPPARAQRRPPDPPGGPGRLLGRRGRARLRRSRRAGRRARSSRARCSRGSRSSRPVPTATPRAACGRASCSGSRRRRRT